MDLSTVSIDNETGSKLTKYDVDVTQVARTTIMNMIISGSGAETGESGLNLDPKKINFRATKKGSQVREFGTLRDEMVTEKDGNEKPGKFFGNMKTLITSIPDTLPPTGSLSIVFPSEVKLFDISVYSSHIIAALKKEIQKCEDKKEYSIADISFADHEIKEFPCAKKLLTSGRTSGRYYGVQTIVLIERMCGASWIVASKKARDFLDKCDGLTDADKTLRIDNVKSLFENSDYHFSCRVVKETFGNEYCSFKNCPIRKKFIQQVLQSNTDPFFYDKDGIYTRRIQVDNETGDEEEIINKFCSNPAWLTKIGDNIDDRSVWCEVTCKDVIGREKSDWVSLKTLLSRDVIELTTNGLNFVERSKGYMNNYFSWAIGAQKPEQTIFVNKCGWKTDMVSPLSFALGKKLYTPDENKDILNTTDKSIIEAMEPSGTVDEWARCMAPILRYDTARFTFYCAAAAPLLRLLDVLSFILHIWGGSGTGKSTMMRSAISMMAKPRAVEQTANIQRQVQRGTQSYSPTCQWHSTKHR